MRRGLRMRNFIVCTRRPFRRRQARTLTKGTHIYTCASDRPTESQRTAVIHHIILLLRLASYSLTLFPFRLSVPIRISGRAISESPRSFPNGSPFLAVRQPTLASMSKPIRPRQIYRNGKNLIVSNLHIFRN